ncbi:MAG: SDR family NAD(P)-dependent oxidoreductase [Saprospiraceae bacterium]|nr:SDR family NAD(P)-dependent oxidoreductase [Saprospiraceae bacterium]
MKNKTWFITGISSGLGKALAEAVIAHGDFVIGTFRQAEQVADFNQKNAGKALAVQLDLTNPIQIRQAMAIVGAQSGRLDVLVNNAGFGFAGAIEEAGDAEMRAVFDANFFGTMQLTQAVLPLMRRQRNGHIFQISSHSGFKGFPGFGVYGASKFALEGASEALAAEVAPLGIRLTIVEPGPFRTGFAGKAFQQANNHIADYDGTAGIFRQKIKAVDGKQEGDPAKAAQAIIRVCESENPPLRLVLGKVAVGTVTAKLQSVQADLDAWREVAERAVF